MFSLRKYNKASQHRPQKTWAGLASLAVAGSVMQKRAMRKFSYIFFGVVAGAIAFNWVGWPYQIRFTLPHLNYWVYASLCVLLPVSILASALATENMRVKVSGIALALVISLPSLFLGFFASIEAKHTMERGEDYSLKLLDQASSPSGTYRLYLTDCGATCSHGLLLRKEIDTNLGVKLVRSEWSVYKQSEAKLHISQNTVKVVNSGITLHEVAR